MIRVLVVDDSAIVRKILTDSLEKADGIEVVGTASNPYIARDKILKLKPDVLTLDIEMPRMDGLTFLSKLMKHHPLPVIIVSSLSPKGSKACLRALELGAIDVFSKPGSEFSVTGITKELAKKIKVASKAQVYSRSVDPATQSIKPEEVNMLQTTKKVLAIGASTGGTEAIRRVLTQLPATTPGTVIVQHMPPNFTKSFAEGLNKQCAMEVREAQGGEILRPGLALLAPGGLHLLVKRSGAQYLTMVKDGPQVHFQKPAVDVLFNAVAKYVGINAVGVVLTGMGSDGARGLEAIHNTGAHCIAQDQATSVVYGMPKAAADIGATDAILPLDRIPKAILNAFQRSEVKSGT